jgi:hypothetical protein
MIDFHLHIFSHKQKCLPQDVLGILKQTAVVVSVCEFASYFILSLIAHPLIWV